MSTTRYDIDIAHSSVNFTVRHMVISKVRGAFSRWAGSLEFDPQDPGLSKVSATIEAASIDTREPKRDEHLRSPDFFDAAKFPTLAFHSKSVEKTGAASYKVTGDLTIHGVTKEITLDTEYLGGGKDPWGGQRVGFQAATKLRRKDFGLGWNQVLEAGGVLVGDDIEITLDIEAVKAAA